MKKRYNTKRHPKKKWQKEKDKWKRLLKKDSSKCTFGRPQLLNGVSHKALLRKG